LSQINNDIKLDNGSNKNVKKDMLNDLKETNIDKNILRELRVSISDENSIISSEQTKTPESSRSSSNSDASASDATSEPLIVPANTPENSICTNAQSCEETINCDIVSELTDDNKQELRDTPPKFSLNKIHTIVEETCDDSINESVDSIQLTKPIFERHVTVILEPTDDPIFDPIFQPFLETLLEPVAEPF